MVLRTLRVPFNMETILMVIFTVIIVDASVREKPIQILRTFATAGLIREYQLEDRQSGCTGGSSCCTYANKCGEDEGDCDRDSDCNEGLNCGSDNCSQKSGLEWHQWDDCCYRPEETVKTWVDLGAGCCSDRRNNALFTGNVEDLDACKKKCLDNGARCKFVEYGWKDSNWCYVVSADAGCKNLLNGHNDCGSVGNDGVHSFEAIYQGQREITGTFTGQLYLSLKNTYCLGSRWNENRERVTEYSTLALAQQACTADAECEALTDYHCDGSSFWICNGARDCNTVQDTSVCDSSGTKASKLPYVGSCTYLKVQWVDLGAGCCSGRNADINGVKYNDDLFKGDVDDLNACKTKCLSYGTQCKYVEYGWKDSKWCYVGSGDEHLCYNLNKGSNDCGSGGNNGVHSYEAIYATIEAI